MAGRWDCPSDMQFILLPGTTRCMGWAGHVRAMLGCCVGRSYVAASRARKCASTKTGARSLWPGPAAPKPDPCILAPALSLSRTSLNFHNPLLPADCVTADLLTVGPKATESGGIGAMDHSVSEQGLYVLHPGGPPPTFLGILDHPSMMLAFNDVR